MNSFTRVLRSTLRYRWNLAGLLVSSLLIALFWGGNLGAVYPIVKVAFQGNSLHEWNADEIDRSETTIQQLHQQIIHLRKTGTTLDGEAVDDPDQEIGILESRLEAEQDALAMARRLQPYIHRYLPDDAFQTVVLIVVLLMFTTILKNAAMFANSMLLARVSQLVLFDFRKQLYHHAQQMDLSEFGEQRIGSMMSRFSVDLAYLDQGLQCLLGKAVREPLKGMACLIGAALISWQLLLFSLLLTPLAAFLIRTLAGSIKRANRRAMEENSQLMGVLSESFSGMQTIKAFTMEKFERNRFHRVSKECLRKSMKIVFYNALARPTTEILGMGVVFTALVAGAYLVLNQETHIFGIPMCERPLSIAALMCFYGLLIGTSDPARKLSDVFNGIQGGVAASERIYGVLDRKPAIVDPIAPRPAPRPHRQLVFDHVNFHYSPDLPVLSDIDFQVRFGETLCIVGPNGCGKTTLVNLLLRFYDPVSGSVRLDDVDLRELRQRDLRRLVGMVTQQTLLFDDTVYNNIRYGTMNASRDEVIGAAHKAHAHRFIEDQLDDGYKTSVGPGGNRLSGGQRQRLALARAILRDPDILVLDEATSQVDIESEQLIHRALDDFVCDRSAIIITHRLSTLELADRILVLEDGRIADLGTHDELIHRCRLYQRLHDIQFRQSA